MSDTTDYRILAKTPVADGVVLVRLGRADGAPTPSWEPGAHLSLHLENGLVREYSLCGDPADTTSLSVAVQRETDGRGGSRYVVDDLAVGAAVGVAHIRNNFPLLDAEQYVLVAGGIGITPILAMARRLAADGRSWRLCYGGRSRSSMAFATELSEEFGSLIELVPQDEYGLLDLQTIVDGLAPDTAVYCCGPEPLLAAMEKVCAPAPVALHVERFSPRGDLETGEDGEFEIELASTGDRYTVPKDSTIIDVLFDNEVEIDVSCEQGTCGTCETRVLSGIPEHRDSLLSEEERAANDRMMICVGRARSARLVLDI